MTICSKHFGGIWPPRPLLATPMPADEGADMSELQAQHYMTPEQWTWLLCRVSVVVANKLLLQEINQVIGIELLTSYFLQNFSS